jgi:RNA polymerase sigma-70 factor (ECF subfamily)
VNPKRPVPTIADATLVRGALDGDPGPALVIVKRYLPLVRRILRASGTGPDLEDTTQEVFARCFQCLPRLRDPTSLRSFIFGIALRLAATERRRRRRRWRERLTPTGELPEPYPSRSDADAREVVSRTREILGRLRPEACLALNLRFVQEKELTEVAANMGVSLATAKRHLARASARVRAMAHGEPVVAEYIRDAAARRGSATLP